jgi:hypothetical protein
MLAAAFGDLPSVDASGQLDVRDEKVDDLPPAPRQRLLAIGCMEDVESFLSQSLNHKLADERVVLDEEYSHRRHLKFLDRVFLPMADALIVAGKPALTDGLAGKRQNPE